MNLIVDGIFGTHKYCNFREFVVLVARVLSPWLREHKNILIYVYLILVVCFSSLCFFFLLWCSIHFICVSIFGCNTDDDAMLDLRTQSHYATIHDSHHCGGFSSFHTAKRIPNFDHSHINCCRYSVEKSAAEF